jgi:hypothetical protein
MSHFVKFGLAATLAIAAGVGNHLYLSSRQKPQQFVATKKPIRKGEQIELAKLSGVPLHGDYEYLRKSFIPDKDEEKGFLQALYATRDYKEGDLILRRDVEKIPPSVLGPFTLLSVGERVRVGTGRQYTEGRGGNSVTVCVDVDDKGNFNEQTNWLLDVIAAQSARDRNSVDPKLRIISVILFANDEAAAGEKIATESASAGKTTRAAADSETAKLASTDDSGGLPIKPNQRALIVPLQSLESIPAVLVRGDKIGFVLPR